MVSDWQAAVEDAALEAPARVVTEMRCEEWRAAAKRCLCDNTTRVPLVLGVWLLQRLARMRHDGAPSARP